SLSVTTIASVDPDTKIRYSSVAVESRPSTMAQEWEGSNVTARFSGQRQRDSHRHGGSRPDRDGRADVYGKTMEASSPNRQSGVDGTLVSIKLAAGLRRLARSRV